MVDYKVEGITEVEIADEPSSVRLAFAAGREPVVLTVDWRLARQLIGRLAIVNHEIRHALSAPDTRAQRIRTVCHRTGIGLAALILLPLLYGLWVWAVGELDPGAWHLIVPLLAAAVLAYGAVWFLGWVVAAFIGTRERPPPQLQSTGCPFHRWACRSHPDMRQSKRY